MKSDPRTRKLVKWGGTIAASLLMLLSIAGKWTYLMWSSGNGGQVYLGRGFVGLFTGGIEAERGWRFGPFKYGTHMFLRFEYSSYSEGTSIRIPLWFPALICGAASGVAWNHDRRALKRLRAGCCTKCGYDRTGIAAESPCPECSSTASIPH